jgi:osmoprotectant transport system substrate-binding protein
VPPTRARPVAALLFLALLGAACGADPSVAPSPSSSAAPYAVRFASYDFRENQILTEVYAEAARRAGLPVEVNHGIGTREIVSPALMQGLVDVVIDYAGTALSFADPDNSPAKQSPEELQSTLARSLSAHGVTVLREAQAEDKNGFAVTAPFAAEHELSALSDLEPLASELRFGGPPECPDRPFCLPGLEKVYGLHFAEVRAMPSRAATGQALLAGQIDVGMLETTDARLSRSGLVLLDDDRGLQPHENVVPLVSTDALHRFGPALRKALEDTSERLTTADLIELNSAVELDGLTPAQAAARWWDPG